MTSPPSFFKQLQCLQNAVRQTPRTDLVRYVVELLVDKDLERSFWDILKTSTWIKPLAIAGCYDSPPDPEKGPWGASRYLARMARREPAEVTEVFSRIVTDNPWVVRNMVQAAMAMPLQYGMKLVPNIIVTLQEHNLDLFKDEIADFIVYLANKRQPAVAFALAYVLLEPEADCNRRQRRGDSEEYWYQQAWETVLPSLARCVPTMALHLACRGLINTMDRQGYLKEMSSEDDSALWRPAVEEHTENLHSVQSALVARIRDATELIVREEKMSLREVLEILERQKYVIFRRIGLHLVNEFAEANTDLARKRMLTRELFDDDEGRFMHEYSRLIGKRFGLLEEADRQQVYGWIQDGPDMTGFDEDFRRWNDRAATEEDRVARKQAWQLQKLWWIRDWLGGEWKVTFEELKDKYGEPHFVDMSVSSGFREPRSPFTVDQLQEMGFEKALEEVSKWREETEDGTWGPRREDLYSAFATCVGRNAVGAAEQATALCGRPPELIQEFIGEMTQHVKDHKEALAKAVLPLCQWVVDEPVPKADKDAEREKWGRLLNSVVEFAMQLLASGIGITYKDLMWSVIRKAADLTAEEFSEMLGDDEEAKVFDFTSRYLNSRAGRAMRAVFEYAKWVRMHHVTRENDKEVYVLGFEVMPGVQKMLRDRLESPLGRDISVRACYGAYFGLLYNIDKAWLEKNAQRIFNICRNQSNSPDPLGWAAWNTLVTVSRSHPEIYRILKCEYRCATRQLPNQKARGIVPFERMAEHLMMLYVWGELNLESDDGIVKAVIESPAVREHALQFVGNVLQEWPADAQSRPNKKELAALWDWYWARGGRYDAENRKASHVFGGWFVSGKLDRKWSIERLHAFVMSAPEAEADDMIVEQLARICAADLQRSVEILEMMVNASGASHRAPQWFKSAKRILRRCMKMEGEIRLRAEWVIDSLGRQGILEAGKLLR
ncbi:MAG: hypothetical protein IT443_02115 [Phycisphaeraceae bacterium]|nr:hypothetical protein [Phycisphaeraceae bacterium]